LQIYPFIFTLNTPNHTNCNQVIHNFIDLYLPYLDRYLIYSSAYLRNVVGGVDYVVGDVIYLGGDLIYLGGEVIYVVRDVNHVVGHLIYVVGGVDYLYADLRKVSHKKTDLLQDRFCNSSLRTACKTFIWMQQMQNRRLCDLCWGIASSIPHK